MWEPRHLTTLWASTACHRDSFTIFAHPTDTRLGDRINLLLFFTKRKACCHPSSCDHTFEEKFFHHPRFISFGSEYSAHRRAHQDIFTAFTLNITVFNATLSISIFTLVLYVSATMGHHQVVLLLLLQLFHCNFAPIHLLDAPSHFLLSAQVHFSVFNNFKILNY
jgi:hypothetical protein